MERRERFCLCATSAGQGDLYRVKISIALAIHSLDSIRSLEGSLSRSLSVRLIPVYSGCERHNSSEMGLTGVKWDEFLGYPKSRRRSSSGATSATVPGGY